MRPKRDKISQELRARVLKRDGYACRYCYSTNGPFHMDHVYPFSKGGETSYANLVTACGRCNVKKGARVGLWPHPIKEIKVRRHRRWQRMAHAAPVLRKTEWMLEYAPDKRFEIIMDGPDCEKIKTCLSLIVPSLIVFVPSVYYVVVRHTVLDVFVALAFSIFPAAALSICKSLLETGRMTPIKSGAEAVAK